MRAPILALALLAAAPAHAGVSWDAQGVINGIVNWTEHAFGWAMPNTSESYAKAPQVHAGTGNAQIGLIPPGTKVKVFNNNRQRWADAVMSTALGAGGMVGVLNPSTGVNSVVQKSTWQEHQGQYSLEGVATGKPAKAAK